MSALKPLVVVLCGATSSGKSTLANLLQKTFVNSCKLHQDDYYYTEDYPGHIKIANGSDEINWELETAFDNHKLFLKIQEDIDKYSDCKELKKTFQLPELSSALESLIAFSNKTLNQSELLDLCQKLLNRLEIPPIILVEGITTLNNSSLRQM